MAESAGFRLEPPTVYLFIRLVSFVQRNSLIRRSYALSYSISFWLRIRLSMEVHVASGGNAYLFPEFGGPPAVPGKFTLFC